MLCVAGIDIESELDGPGADPSLSWTNTLDIAADFRLVRQDESHPNQTARARRQVRQGQYQGEMPLAREVGWTSDIPDDVNRLEPNRSSGLNLDRDTDSPRIGHPLCECIRISA